MTKLQVLIATYGQEGLDRLSRHRLPPIKEVEYLVSCQCPEGTPVIPPSLIRKDLKISFSSSIGSSVNRNILLTQATAPYGLIADDDLDFIAEGLEKIIVLFENEPSLDVISLQYSDREGKNEKKYPNYNFNLSKFPKGFYISCIELAFRRKRIMDKGILFNERFGVRCIYPCGEEDIWLYDILKSGLRGEYFPIKITIHDGPSTGIRECAKPGVLRAQAVIISRHYPLTGFLRIILKAWRVSRKGNAYFLKCLYPALRGWKDYILHKRVLFNNPCQTSKKK